MSWYCLYIKTKKEFSAEQHLMAQGLEVYLPRTTIGQKKKRGNTNRIIQVEPLFPNYLFINLTEGVHDFCAVKNTRGVQDFAMKSLVRVPEYIIKELRSNEDDQGVHYISEDQYQPGERVRINKGAFKFYEAIISKRKNERIWIILEMLGEQEIMINPQDIESVT